MTLLEVSNSAGSSAGAFLFSTLEIAVQTVDREVSIQCLNRGKYILKIYFSERVTLTTCWPQYVYKYVVVCMWEAISHNAVSFLFSQWLAFLWKQTKWLMSHSITFWSGGRGGPPAPAAHRSGLPFPPACPRNDPTVRPVGHRGIERLHCLWLPLRPWRIGATSWRHVLSRAEVNNYFYFYFF